MCRPTFFLLLLLSLGIAIRSGADNLGPVDQEARFFAPYYWELLETGEAFCEAMRSQGYECDRYLEVYGIGEYGINKYKEILNNYEDRGVLMVCTHGDEQGATHESYWSEQLRDDALNYHINHGGWNSNDLEPTRSIYGGFGISIRPHKIQDEFKGHDRQTLVIYDACWAGSWLASAYLSGTERARCAIGCVDADNCYSFTQFAHLLIRLDGQMGQNMRIVSNVQPVLPHLAFLGDLNTNLRPTVTSVDPPLGTVFSSVDNNWVEVTFDSIMDRDRPTPVSVTAGPATVRNLQWIGSTRLRFEVRPYNSGDIELTLGSNCRSKSNALLDGNQCPSGTNGVGPAWCGSWAFREPDPYIWTYASTVPQDPNSAANFEGCWAFRDTDGVHVLWITDPEIGSTAFHIYGGANREDLLKVIPAAGSTLPHYYEETVQSDADFFEVVEEVADPNTRRDSTRPFRISESPPPNLSDLRNLNSVVANWTPTPITPIRTDITVNREIDPVDFVFYTSRAIFWYQAHAISSRLEQDGWTSAVHLGSSDPNEAKALFQGYYEAAVDQNYWRLPLCVVVGEANEGHLPDCNVVGTFYVEDEQDQCYWNSCASDIELTNFYGDGPECPVSRVVACTIEELDKIIRSALEYYDSINVSEERVLAIVGDLTNFCNPADPPRLLIDEVRAWYTDHGFPFIQYDESSYSCYDFTSRYAVFCSEINAGLTEIIGTGRVTNRSVLPGSFCQKLIAPIFKMEDLPARQRIICQFPGCGMADADRNNPNHYPSIAKMFLTAEPDSGTSAVAWLSHSRGGSEHLHLTLAREYFGERLEAPAHLTVQDVFWTVVRRLWQHQPSMRPFLRMAMAFGFPVQFPGSLTPVEAQEELPETVEMGLVGMPSPGREIGLRYSLPGIGRVRLAVYDVSGRLVRTLVSPAAIQSAGTRTVEWDGRRDSGVRATAGLYFARLEVNGRSAATRKIVLLP